MKVVIIILLLLAVLEISNLLLKSSQFSQKKTALAKPVPTATIRTSMRITSPAFEANKPIPQAFACDGNGINPKLIFSEVPKEAKSLVLIMDDPDAPMGTFVHWVVFNMPPVIKEIAENTQAPGTQGKNGAGKTGYIAPCPPSGTHRYFFKLTALDAALSIPEGSNKTEVENAMQGHIISSAEYIGLYSKK